MANTAKELNFYLHFILIDLNINGHMVPVGTLLDRAGLRHSCILMFSCASVIIHK